MGMGGWGGERGGAWEGTGAWELEGRGSGCLAVNVTIKSCEHGLGYGGDLICFLGT